MRSSRFGIGLLLSPALGGATPSRFACSLTADQAVVAQPMVSATVGHPAQITSQSGWRDGRVIRVDVTLRVEGRAVGGHLIVRHGPRPPERIEVPVGAVTPGHVVLQVASPMPGGPLITLSCDVGG